MADKYFDQNNIESGVKTCDLHALVSSIDVENMLCFWILFSRFCCYGFFF